MDEPVDAAATTLPTDPDDPNAALAKLLQKELAAQQAHEAHAGVSNTGEPLIFGMTMGAIFLGFVVSVVGVALANYGRVTSSFVFVACGVGMIAVPFFITSSVGLAIAGGALLAIPLVLRRLRAI